MDVLQHTRQNSKRERTAWAPYSTQKQNPLLMQKRDPAKYYRVEPYFAAGPAFLFSRRSSSFRSAVGKPETPSMEDEPMPIRIDSEACCWKDEACQACSCDEAACTGCVEACTVGALKRKSVLEYDQALCTDCGACVDACTQEAIVLC